MFCNADEVQTVSGTGFCEWRTPVFSALSSGSFQVLPWIVINILGMKLLFGRFVKGSGLTQGPSGLYACQILGLGQVYAQWVRSCSRGYNLLHPIKAQNVCCYYFLKLYLYNI